MKHIHTFLVLLLFSLTCTHSGFASHLFGGDLRYEYQSSNGSNHTYKIILIAYGDCNGSAFTLLSSGSATVNIFKNGQLYNTTPSLYLSLIPAQSNIEITPVCPDEAGNTACSYPSTGTLPPGVLPGIKKFTFEGTVVLDGAATWQFSFTGNLGTSTAGRSNQIQNLSPVGTTGLIATLNNSKGQNSSPNFTASPTPFFCVDKEYTYSLAPVDPDNDRMAFSMAPAMDGAGNSTYIAPYTSSRPFPAFTGSFNFNATTGEITFIPVNPQDQSTFRSIVANKAFEIRNGDTVGTCMREMTFVFLNDCNNSAPIDSLSNVENGSVINRQVIQACEGQTDTIRFRINTRDPDGDNISVSWNNLPTGAIARVVNDSTPDPTFEFEWHINDSVPTGDYTFYITLVDDGCPLSVQKTLSQTISILPFQGGLSSGVQAPCKGEGNGFAWLQQASSDTNTYRLAWTDRRGDTLQKTNSRTGDTLFNLSPGTYYATATNKNGCSKLFTIEIPEPIYGIVITAPDTTGCVNDQFLFTNASFGEWSRFTWNFGDGSAPSGQTNAFHTYTHEGVFTVTLYGSTPLGCKDTASVNIYIDTIYTPTFTTDKDSICTGDRIIFYPDTGPHVISAYWIWGTLPDYNFQPDNSWHSFDQPGHYPVILHVAYRNCPEAEYRKTVHVLPYPVADLGPDSSLCLKGEALVLRNTALDQVAGYRYQWSTGDTTEQILAREPGSYGLTVIASQNCHTTETVTVRKDCFLDIPNSFTPNGDGINDYFFPRQLKGKNIIHFRMQILNRWGQILYETENTNGRGWDGKRNSHDQPAGAYLYIIEVMVGGQRIEKYTGNVTLLR